MSDSPVAIRAIALSEAVKHGSENVIGMANIFLDFLNGETSVVKTEKSKPVKTKAVEKAEPAEPKGPTKVDIGTAVEKMLAANKRTEAVALMKKFGAGSVSTLAESDYAAFLAAADAILMTA